MVFIRFDRVFIFPEAFSSCIVIMAYGWAVPACLALDAEMIVGFFYQHALAGAGFVDALCQRNGSRYTGADHFLYRDFLVGGNVLTYNRRRLRMDYGSSEEAEEKEKLF